MLVLKMIYLSLFISSHFFKNSCWEEMNSMGMGNGDYKDRGNEVMTMAILRLTSENI